MEPPIGGLHLGTLNLKAHVFAKLHNLLCDLRVDCAIIIVHDATAILIEQLRLTPDALFTVFVGKIRGK